MRERQLMAAEAGPSDADDEGEEEEFAELQEPPFPEPEVQPKLLYDLLAQAAELDAAAVVEESEYPQLLEGGCVALAAAALSASQQLHTPAVSKHTAQPCLATYWPHHRQAHDNGQAACSADRSRHMPYRKGRRVSAGTQMVPQKLTLLCLLFVCRVLPSDFPDLEIGGISDEPDCVMPGDLYCCVEHITRSSFWNGHDPDIVEAALEAGAVAILAEAGTEFPEGLIPDSVPVVYAEDVDELATRLAAVLHGEAQQAALLPV